jgi:putative lumazine-binding protein
VNHTNRIVIACAALVVAAARANGQSAPDREGVRRAVLDYVEGFYEGDTAKLVRSVHPDVQKYGFWIPRDSTRYSGEAMPWSEFLSYARGIRARGSPARADAPKEITVFDVRDQTASAMLRAWWGMDYLLLAKYDGRWMVRMVLWQSPPRPTPP